MSKAPKRRRATPTRARPARRAPTAPDLGPERFRVLTRLNRLITASLDLDEVLREIARAAATLMPDALASFSTVDEAARTLEIRAWSDEEEGRGIAGPVHRFDEGLLGLVATTRSVPGANATVAIAASEAAKSKSGRACRAWPAAAPS